MSQAPKLLDPTFPIMQFNSKFSFTLTASWMPNSNKGFLLNNLSSTKQQQSVFKITANVYQLKNENTIYIPCFIWVT